MQKKEIKGTYRFMQWFVWLLRKERSEMVLTDTQKKRIRQKKEREDQL